MHTTGYLALNRAAPEDTIAASNPGIWPRLRRVRAADARAMQAFINDLSPRSRRGRFHGALRVCSNQMAEQMVLVDGTRHAAWVACGVDGGQDTIVGEVRYVRSRTEPRFAELAIVVADAWQGLGVADALMRQLVQCACDAGITLLYGDVQQSNRRMLAFMCRHSFVPDNTIGPDSHGLCLARQLPPVRSTSMALVLQPRSFDT